VGRSGGEWGNGNERGEPDRVGGETGLHSQMEGEHLRMLCITGQQGDLPVLGDRMKILLKRAACFLVSTSIQSMQRDVWLCR